MGGFLGLIGIGFLCFGVVALFRPKVGGGRARGWICIAIGVALGTLSSALAPEPAPPPPPPTAAELAQGVREMRVSLTTETAPCDLFASGAIVKLQKGDWIRAYEEIEQAKVMCLNAAGAVKKVKIPNTIPSKFRAGFQEAFNSCARAYQSRSGALGMMGTIMRSGDASSSKISEAATALKASEDGVMLCSIAFMKAGTEAGVPVESFIDAVD